jgi:hypothetical protein
MGKNFYCIGLRAHSLASDYLITAISSNRMCLPKNQKKYTTLIMRYLTVSLFPGFFSLYYEKGRLNWIAVNIDIVRVLK